MINLTNRAWMPEWGFPLWNVATAVAFLPLSEPLRDVFALVGIIALIWVWIERRRHDKRVERENPIKFNGRVSSDHVKRYGVPARSNEWQDGYDVGYEDARWNNELMKARRSDEISGA